MTYASPETVQAYEETQDLIVTPQQDIWALGVMVCFQFLSASLFLKYDKKKQILLSYIAIVLSRSVLASDKFACMSMPICLPWCRLAYLPGSSSPRECRRMR